MQSQAVAVNPLSSSKSGDVHTHVGGERVQHMIVSSIEDVIALEQEWTDLSARCANRQSTFQSFSWCLEWCRHFLGDATLDEQLAIVCGYVGDQLVSIWPTVMERKFGLRTLKWLGEPVSQYGDVLVLDDSRQGDWIREGLRFIETASGCDVVNLGKVREDSPLAKVLAEDGYIPSASEQAPFVDLQQHDSMDSFRKAQSKKTRRTRRRMRVLLEEQGPLSFSIFRGGRAAMVAIDSAFAFKAAWLEERGIISRAFSDERVLEFWKGLARQDDERCGLTVAVLFCGDQPLAIELGLRTGDVHVAHVGSFHPDFEKFSPGSLQMEEVIADCFERGIAAYDLLAPSDAYKERWTGSSVAVSDYVLPVTTAGRAWSTLSGLQLQKLAKEQFARLPKFARQSIAQAAGIRVTGGMR